MAVMFVLGRGGIMVMGVVFGGGGDARRWSSGWRRRRWREGGGGGGKIRVGSSSKERDKGQQELHTKIRSFPHWRVYVCAVSHFLQPPPLI